MKPRTFGQLDGSRTGSIIGKRTWGLHLSNFRSGIESIYFFQDFDGGTGYWYSTHGIIPLNEWSHICVTYDNSSASNHPQFYLNGSSITTTRFWTPSGTALTDNTYNLAIGDYRASGGSGHFDGFLDEVKLYNYIRTPAQIAYDYNRGKPIGWWQFDECQGTTAYDASGNGNNGTITPGAGTSPDNNSVGTCDSSNTNEMWNDGTTGKFSSSLGFDGNDDYVGMGNLSLIGNLTEASVCAWIKYDPASVTTDGAILSHYNGNESGWLLWVDDDAANSGRSNTVSFAIDAYAGDGRVEGSTDLVTSGTWDHYCGVFKGGDSIKLYKNGVLNQSTSTSVSNISSSSNNFSIGSVDNNSRFFEGQIDDAKVFNYALSAAQIKKEYNGGTTVYFGP